jgi:hypothetical protein
MSAMTPLLSKRHNQCRAKSHGAEFYLVPDGLGVRSTAWCCYSTTAAQVRRLMGHESDIHKCANWEDDEFTKPFWGCAVPEKHVRQFIDKLSVHGSVAIIEPSSHIGADRETVFECICVVPKQGGQTPDDDDLL